MTNHELTYILMKAGVPLGSFIIVNNEKSFMDQAVKYKFCSHPVWDDISYIKFVDYLKDTNGLNVIFNSGVNEFEYRGGFIRTYEDTSPVAMRKRKLSKINYEIFRKRIVSSL